MLQIRPAGRTAFLGAHGIEEVSEPWITLASQTEDVQLGLEAQRLIFSMLAKERFG